MANIKADTIQVQEALVYKEANQNFEAMVVELKRDKGVGLAVEQGYKSAYDVLDELRKMVKNKNSQGTDYSDDLADDLDAQNNANISGLLDSAKTMESIIAEDKYETLKGYIESLRSDEFEPALSEGYEGGIPPDYVTTVYPYPNKLSLDPRRSGRFIKPKPVDVFKQVEVQKWLVNNGLRYGFVLYGDDALYYIGLEKAANQVRSAGNREQAYQRILRRFTKADSSVGSLITSNATSFLAYLPPPRNSNTNNSTIVTSGGSSGWKEFRKDSLYGSIKSNTTPLQVMQFLQQHVEGGYYHPAHSYGKSGYALAMTSGETMFGEDRAAGQSETISDTARQFWALIDKHSGFGDYGTGNASGRVTAGAGRYNDNYSRAHVTNIWPEDVLRTLSARTGVWTHYFVPEGALGTQLKNMSSQIGLDKTTTYINNYYGTTPGLKQKILADGRLFFCMVRARYNGVGYFQGYASDLKQRYTNDPQASNDQLIEWHLDYKYEYTIIKKYKQIAVDLIQMDTKKIANLIGWPK